MAKPNPVGVFNTQKMHTQLVGRADFKDLARREDINRNRAINTFLLIGAILLLGYSVLRARFGWNELAVWTLFIGGVLLLILLYRWGFVKKRRRPQKTRHKTRSRVQRGRSKRRSRGQSGRRKRRRRK